MLNTLGTHIILHNIPMALKMSDKPKNHISRSLVLPHYIPLTSHSSICLLENPPFFHWTPIDQFSSIPLNPMKFHLSPWNPYISSCLSLFIQSTSMYPYQVTRLPLGFEAWSPWTGRWWRWAARARSGTPISGRRCGCYGACDSCGCCGWSNWGVRNANAKDTHGYPLVICYISEAMAHL